MGGSSDWLLGDAFMRGWYSIHDADNMRMGWYSIDTDAKPNPTAKTSTPTEEMPRITFIKWHVFGIRAWIFFTIFGGLVWAACWFRSGGNDLRTAGKARKESQKKTTISTLESEEINLIILQ